MSLSTNDNLHVYARRRSIVTGIPLLFLLLATSILSACGGGVNLAHTGASGATNTGAGTIAPTITTQPTSQIVTLGSAATFTVGANGTATITYQWFKSGTAISGASSTSYTTPITTVSDNNTAFTVTISNAQGSVTSSPATLTVSSASTTAVAGTDVTTYKNDLSRSGLNSTETGLTPSNVVSTGFGLLRTLALDGKADAQPLYLSKLSISGGVHNVVFAATEHDSVYAIDADTGIVLWHVTALAGNETPSDAIGCGQVTPEIGITSTPVIDRSAGPHGVIYIVAMTKDSSANYHQRIHALDVTTGAEMFNGPTTIAASYPTAGGSSTTFDPGQYEDRAALLLLNGTVYTSWTSHCDIQPYTGWIIGFNAATLSRSTIFNVGPNSNGAGPAIWMGGGGPAADSAGNLYLLTANGSFETTLDANGFPSEQDYGNSFVKLSVNAGQLKLTDYFTMFNEIAESLADQDLGASGILLLPDLMDASAVVRHLAVGAGKDGNIYVVNRDSMGHFNAKTNNIWQVLSAAVPAGVRSTPAYFNNIVFYSELGGTLKAFSIAKAMLSNSASSQTANHFAYPGTAPAISASGTSNAIVWAYENSNPAVLHAYDAHDLAHEYYNSNQAAANRDQFGAGNKFIAPTIADGKVFLGTTNAIAVFGLLH